MAESEGSRGCGWCLGVGCAVLAVVVLVLAALIASNWGRIQGWIEQGTETFSGMLAVQRDLAREFPCEGTSLNIHVGGGQKTLRIGLTEPAFDPREYGGWEGAARAVAMFVAERYPELLDVDAVVVELTTVSGSATTDHRYELPVGELLPPPTATPSVPAEGSAENL